MLTRKIKRIISLFTLIMTVEGCAIEVLQVQQGELVIRVEPGDDWLHRYSAIKKNPPQIAVWAEREDGRFGGTIFVTRKVATGNWTFNNGNPRKEALPIWKHRKEGSVTDAITGASPRSSFTIAVATREGGAERRFYLYAEFNHSTDWNSVYPKSADRGGSGQPSLLYRTLVDLDSPANRFVFEIVGHGSPDGSDGAVVADLSSLTSALHIVSSIVAERTK